MTASELLNEFWLVRDYFPAFSLLRTELDPWHIAALLGGSVRVEPLPVPHDCRDGFGEAFWDRPEAYLSPGVRAGISAFALLDETELGRGLRQLEADLRSGAWDSRYGHLRGLPEYDRGLRLIVATGIGSG